MREVTIKKSGLVKIIKKNKDRHRELFEEAYTEYGHRVVANLERMLKATKTGKPQEVSLHFNLIKPKDHTSDYEQVLEMLELEVNETITLSREEFRNLVQDNWGWAGEFTASYTSNVGRPPRT